MHDDEADVAANTYAQRKKDLFSHHRNDRPCVRGGGW